MSKEKDLIILLKDNGSIELTDIYDVDDKTKRSSKTKYVIIDVGLITPEYIIVPRERFIRKFKRAQMAFDYNLTIYAEEFEVESEPNRCEMDCKNVIDFYRAVHSIKKIETTNSILHDDFYYITAEGKFVNTELCVSIKKDTKSVNIERELNSDSKHDASTVLEILSFLTYGDASIPILTDKDSIPSLSLDLDKKVWYPKPYKGKIMCNFEPDFGCAVFTNHGVVSSLELIRDFTMSITNYVFIKQSHLPEGEKITSKNIEEYDGAYIESLRECDVNAYAQGHDILMEMLSNLEHIFKCAELEASVIYGEMDVRSLLTISYSFITFNDSPDYGRRVTFDYDVDRQRMNKGIDFLSDFVHSLDKNFDRYIKGEIEDDE